MAGGSHVNIRTRLIGLGFQRELEPVLSVDVVFAKIIDRFAQSLHSLIGTAAGIGFDAFAAAPQHKNLCAQLRPEIHGAHSFLQCVGAHVGIVCRKGTVTKNGMKKQRHRGHRDDEFVIGAGFFELAHNGVAFRRSGIDGHQVVVMKVDAPGSHFAEHGNDLDGRNDRANEIAERIAPPVPERPEPERKLMFGFWLVSVIVRHGLPPWLSIDAPTKGKWISSPGRFGGRPCRRRSSPRHSLKLEKCVPLPAQPNRKPLPPRATSRLPLRQEWLRQRPPLPPLRQSLLPDYRHPLESAATEATSRLLHPSEYFSPAHSFRRRS